PDELSQLRSLAKRALAHEPVQYLVGEASFYGISLKADKRALIPRPETQALVDEAVAAIKTIEDRPPRVADVCTGSGCVAIAIASQAPDAIVLASDIDAEALTLATENVERHGLAERVSLCQGDLLAALPESDPFDAIIANPPYIPDDEWESVAANVKDHEPTHALRGGVDGLDFVRRIIDGAFDRLQPGGLLAIEVAASRADEAVELVGASPYANDVGIVRDFTGRPRVVRAFRRE
ncbi:MAG: peptide chain release factor N(5)-glutamine methyltransferase, partial [Phycisphaerales bacterium]|nr:peptide chain release factor N(5)-glutamine methyltransferase [Phycisphaerales bacterium]